MFAQRGVSFVVQIILARLLLPEQFGLIAMVTVFVAIMNVIADCGFSRAIIPRKDLESHLVEMKNQFSVLGL